MMKITVLIITYNHEAFISQTLESVLMQKTNFDYEILISEDHSTDSTRDLIGQYQKKNPEKIKLLLSEKNQNDNEVLVRGLLAAQGQYIAMSDGDDYWTSPNKLQKQVDFLDAHPECVVCFHNVLGFYQDGSKEAYLVSPPDQKNYSTIEDLLYEDFIPTCSVMFRNGLVEEFPDWYKSIFAADWSLFIFLAQYGKIGYINEVMGAYRHHSAGAWSGMKRRDRLYTIIAMYKHLLNYLKPKHKRLIRDQLSKFYYQLALDYKNCGDTIRAGGYFLKSLTENPRKGIFSLNRKVLSFGVGLFGRK
jgi:glycosyltransferase involved in cell wall biosynthesis